MVFREKKRFGRNDCFKCMLYQSAAEVKEERLHFTFFSFDKNIFFTTIIRGVVWPFLKQFARIIKNFAPFWPFLNVEENSVFQGLLKKFLSKSCLFLKLHCPPLAWITDNRTSRLL
jgi:hypothetical protein